MIAEIGHFALALALVLSIMLSVLPIVGSLKGILAYMHFAKPATRALFALVGIAYFCLTYNFISDDFSVAYVANNNNSQLPLLYKITAVWGGHEGSLLLWIFILCLWMLMVVLFTKPIPEKFSALVLAIMNIICAGFLSFLLFTSNPFGRLWPIPLEGRDLNPLLQDIGLVLHPPMLYMGYVGFSVVFAFAITALIQGKMDAAWVRWSRPWTNIAWMFLTIGIALGSWWAYYELGWGGWWFWDPVENASFMPWLIGTALVHSLAATEKRGVFKSWTILLAIFTFSLSLLGTFLVRSGILTSVHAFATDPTRGLYILMFLAIVIGGSLTLYTLRVQKITSPSSFSIISRETALLSNNILFGVLCFVVLLGTLYPLVLDILNLGKISVGPPYFDLLFKIIGMPVLFMTAVGSALRWKKDSLIRLSFIFLRPLIISMMIAFVIVLTLPSFNIMVFVAFVLSLFIWIQTLQLFYKRLRIKDLFSSARKIPLHVYAMTVAHIGLGFFVIGVVMTSSYSIENDIRMKPGDNYTIGQYNFIFDGVNNTVGPNYNAIQGQLTVKKNGKKIATMKPEKRRYLIRRSTMTEAAISPGFTRDLYIAMGEPLDDQKTWAMRIYYKPYIRWIWLGALIMSLGGFLGAIDKRYRNKANTNSVQSTAKDI